MDLERLRGKGWKRRIAGIVTSVAAIATFGLFSTTASAADMVAEPIQTSSTSSVSSASSVTASNSTSSTGSFAGTSLVSQSSTSVSQSASQQSVAGSSSGAQTQQSASKSTQSEQSAQSTSSGSSLTSASAEAESTTRITSVDQPSKPTETNSGNKPKLPSKLTAHWSDGSESQTPIAWNTSGVDFSNRTGKDRTVTVTGTVCVGDDSDNNGGSSADGSKANGSKANSAGSDAKSSNGTANSAANSAANGVANGASGNASNNNTSNNTVGVCEKLLSGQSGDVTASGTNAGSVVGGAGAATASGASASANSSPSSDGVVSVKTSVIVHSAAVTGVVVDGETSVTTASGTKPQLPVNAKVSWNDGGDDSLEPIDWPQFDGYRTRDGGTFTLGGLVVDRTVNVRVTVTPAVVKSVDDTVSVTTVVGKAPTMPGTVKVTWTNGDVIEAPATWDAIPADSYRNPGTFTVSGTVTTGSEQDGDLETHAVTAKVIVGTIAYEVQYGDDDGAAVQSGSNGTGINIPTDNKTVTTDTRQTSQSQLSKTGTEVAAIAVIVVVLAVIGAVVVIVVRRRR
ncbi:Bacterial Ig-like domain (group 4) [Bifidobacterium tissieri]|uniref:Bacterial Ig-like domain (Group 4) n=1 Tax=Bifidobacterium tissieri TaxID=1630162 RepID=A0A261FHL6_9BIFI|nr:Ig-like domain-containing protein [Bifidobacterium tissieri]OZG58642.1 Bacterial Ig-like domain (group 4) [Bifidobacterium tissieri]